MVVKFDSDKVRKMIKEKDISQQTIAELVLNVTSSAFYNYLTRGEMEKEKLIKLCKLIGTSIDNVMIDAPKPEKIETTENGKTLETILLGLNQVFQMQKEYNETMKNLLIEIKALNTKQNRLENALGQIVVNTLGSRDNSEKMLGKMTDTNSTLNIISGRVKDMWKK